MNMKLQFCTKVDIGKLSEIQDLASYISAVFIEPTPVVWNLPNVAMAFPLQSKEKYSTLIEKHREARMGACKKRGRGR